MEATRSLFLCIIDYRIFFAFLALFTRIVSVTDLTTSTASDTSTSILAIKSGSTVAHDVAAHTSAISTVSVLASSAKLVPTILSSKHSSEQPSVTEKAPTHGKNTSALNVPTTTESHISKKPGHKDTTNTSDLHPATKQKTIDTQTDAVTHSDKRATTALSNDTAVLQKDNSTSGPLTTSTEITSIRTALKPVPRDRPGQVTTPWMGVPPDMSMTTAQTTAAYGTAAPASGPSVPLIIAIILFLLLVLALLMACLYCRRRRRSGSTSFNAAGWAGQVALPDDTGLDKDVEQGPLVTGEGEGRRATLTTFFGKRQSRVASVAMEEIDEKEREEAQQLIGGNAGQDSSPQGPGEANGKVPEPTQKETPPTHAE